jgi:hypothetical protein
MVGCMGRISYTNLKNRVVISGIATPKNHIELLVPRSGGFEKSPSPAVKTNFYKIWFLKKMKIQQ